MLNEKTIDLLIQPIIDRQNQIETTVIMKIADRLKKIKTMIPSDVYKLERLLKTGSDVREINEELARLSGIQEREIKKIIKTVAKDAYEDARPYYDYREKAYIPFEKNAELQTAIKAVEQATLGDYKNLSNSTAFMMRDLINPLIIRPTPASEAYQKVVDLAIQSVTMGTESYSAVIPRAIQELVNSGMRTIDNTQKVEYTTNSGKKHYVRMDTAVRRNILDGIRDISQTVQRITGEQFGSDGVELSVHRYSAPDHEPVQGHQFTNEEFEKMQLGQDFEDVSGIKFKGFDRPIGLWNCRHIAMRVVLAHKTPNYTIDELEKLKAENANGITIKDKDGKETKRSMYWCTQKQRQYELEIKKAKEGEMAAEKAGESELVKKYNAKVYQKQTQYEQFCKDCGLKPRYDKTRVYTKDSPIKTVDSIDISRESGIINYDGLAAKIGGENVPMHEEPKLMKVIDIKDEKAIINELIAFEKTAVDESIETACVITKDGEVWKCFGISDRVFPDFDLGDKLYGSYVSHNHPISVTECSFSDGDYKLFKKYNLSVLRGVDEKYEYEFNASRLQIDSPAESVFELTEEDYAHERSITNAKEGGIGYWRVKKKWLK